MHVANILVHSPGNTLTDFEHLRKLWDTLNVDAIISPDIPPTLTGFPADSVFGCNTSYIEVNGVHIYTTNTLTPPNSGLRIAVADMDEEYTNCDILIVPDYTEHPQILEQKTPATVRVGKSINSEDPYYLLININATPDYEVTFNHSHEWLIKYKSSL